MTLIILLVTLFATYGYNVNGQSCTTPSGGKGTCKSIYQCDALLNLINKNDRTPDDIQLLDKSQCGSQGTTPSLCCPETCYTPDNHPGRCVSIFTCPHLLNLLRLPVSQETMTYLQYSRCLDSKQFSVCCGPPPILSPGLTQAIPATNRPLTTFASSPNPLNNRPLIKNQEPPVSVPATNRPTIPFALYPNPLNNPPSIQNQEPPVAVPATNRPTIPFPSLPNPLNNPLLNNNQEAPVAVPATNRPTIPFPLSPKPLNNPLLNKNQEPPVAVPVTNRPTIPFASSPNPLNNPPLILNQGSPFEEPVTNPPVTTSTVPSNVQSPTTSSDTASTNRVVDGMNANDTNVSESQCLTPNGEAGTCKSIRQCAMLLDLVTKKNRTLEETELLRRSQCGSVGGSPAVCCPDLCYTPDGQPGTCKSIYSCPNLKNLLLPVPSNESIQYILNSRCQGSDMYSMCCGPLPDLSPPPKGNCAATVSAFPPDPRTECCGVDRSVDNEQVAPGFTRIDQYPWLVLIEYIKNDKARMLCAGGLISTKYVLTTAHCITGPILDFGTPVNVHLGEHNLNNEGPDCELVNTNEILRCTDGTIVIPIEQVIPHPDYNIPNRQNDIGLIRMQNSAPFTDFIRPVCLPREDITVSPPSDLIFYAAGWGYVHQNNITNQVKLHVDLPYANLETCKLNFYTPSNELLWDTLICAGGGKRKNACRGDIGGPLMYQNGNTFEIIGIASFGPASCVQRIPAVYTKTYAYNTWIRRTIRP